MFRISPSHGLGRAGAACAVGSARFLSFVAAPGESPSPVPTRHPNLADAGSRKTLIYLILTLNHMYPDYDFSNLRAHVRCRLERPGTPPHQPPGIVNQVSTESRPAP